MSAGAEQSTGPAIAIPEASAEGVVNFLDQAAQHVVEAEVLRDAADANSNTDLRGNVLNANRRDRANALVSEALLIGRVLDAVLPLPDEATWQDEISRRRHAIEEQADTPAQA